MEGVLGANESKLDSAFIFRVDPLLHLLSLLCDEFSRLIDDCPHIGRRNDHSINTTYTFLHWMDESLTNALFCAFSLRVHQIRRPIPCLIHIVRIAKLTQMGYLDDFVQFSHQLSDVRLRSAFDF